MLFKAEVCNTQAVSSELSVVESRPGTQANNSNNDTRKAKLQIQTTPYTEKQDLGFRINIAGRI